MKNFLSYKFSLRENLEKADWDTLRRVLSAYNSDWQVDINETKQVFRVVTKQKISQKRFKQYLEDQGFSVKEVSVTEQTVPQEPDRSSCELVLCVEGMSCRSCELTLERAWKKLPGVESVEVNASSGRAKLQVSGESVTVEQLQKAIGDEKYQVSVHVPKSSKKRRVAKPERPSFLKLVGLFLSVFLLGKILIALGLFDTNFSVTESTTFGAIFVIGLVAASSSCIAVVGGLLLSSTARFNERYGSQSASARMRPVGLFVLGRIVSYTVLGGLLGVVGGFLSPPPLVTAMITLLAALYMLIMGLEMLHIAPHWVKRLLPRAPKSLSHKILDAEGKEHWAMPFVLGGATFFLPCGFTQALQLYALTTGSFGVAASIMLAFALGTAPALLLLGYASSSIKGKWGKRFFQFSGALVVVLGFWNIQNAFSIAGFSVPSLSSGVNATELVAEDPNVQVVDGVQVVKMKVNPYGYVPENFVIEAGKPVRWEVDATNAGGCASVLVSRQIGVQKVLDRGLNVFEFTPSESGRIAFSCSMGMYRGSFQVVPSRS